MPTEKSESKPETTEDPATDEEHPQDALRREGMRLNPQWQTEHLDTSGGGPVDLHRSFPAFEEARQHAVRAAALAADEDVPPDNVVFAEDADVADRQRELARKLAKDVPDEEPDRRLPGAADGMAGPYNQGVVPTGDDGDSGTTAKPATTSSTSTAAKTPSKSTSTSTTAKKTETK